MASSRANRHQRVLEGNADRPRTWTRSQSPLRQLLNAGSTSRPGSPRRSLSPNQLDDHGDLDVSTVTSNTGQTSTVPALAATTGKHGGGCASHQPSQQQQQQPQQQQRVCMKNVFRPVSYDECHVLSEQGNDGYSVGIGSAAVASSASTAIDNDTMANGDIT